MIVLLAKLLLDESCRNFIGRSRARVLYFSRYQGYMGLTWYRKWLLLSPIDLYVSIWQYAQRPSVTNEVGVCIRKLLEKPYEDIPLKIPTLHRLWFYHVEIPLGLTSSPSWTRSIRSSECLRTIDSSPSGDSRLGGGAETQNTNFYKTSQKYLKNSLNEIDVYNKHQANRTQSKE